MIGSRKAPVLGIDLGTVTSMACVLEEGKPDPTVIRPHPGTNWPYDWMPSVFCLADRQVLVGRPALQKLGHERHRQNVVRCVKRYMRYSEPLFPRANPQFSPVDVSEHILRHLRRAAEQQLGLAEGAITEAVVTVPAYFGQVERANTRRAAAQAGFDLDKVRLLDEPVAAAFGLRLHEQPGERLALVIDLGGGTLDVTLLRIGRAVGTCGFQELGRDGYGKLGGIDWDRAVARLAVFQHPDLDGRGPEYLEPDNWLLYEKAEQAKINFCTVRQTLEQRVTFWDEAESRNIDSLIGRDEFFAATRELAELCGHVADRMLREVSEADLAQVRSKRKGPLGSLLFFLPPSRLQRIEWEDIDCIYMVGGGSLNTEVQNVIADRWGRPVEQLVIANKPQHQVAFGAARCAATLSRRDSLFEGTPLRSPHTVGYYYYPTGKQGHKCFQPVIRRNERIVEKHGEQFCCPVGGDGATLTVELAEEQLDPRNDRAEYVNLGEIRLTDLPPRRFGEVEYVHFELQCLHEREMRITAQFRGRRKTVIPNAANSFDGNGSL